jgi:hypothetical protein
MAIVQALELSDLRERTIEIMEILARNTNSVLIFDERRRATARLYTITSYIQMQFYTIAKCDVVRGELGFQAVPIGSMPKQIKIIGWLS